jgi:MiaB/RimO family radical SAM methylthiotransferase
MIAVVNQGCAANFGDGEKIARILSQKDSVRFGFPEQGSKDVPDEFYLNVCTVKGNAGAIKLLRRVMDEYPDSKIYITGCAPKDLREEIAKITDKVIYTNREEITARFRVGARNEALRESPFVGIVNIEEGCLDACAFCSTHLVKGRLHSYSPEIIESQVRQLTSDGCKEIQLTGQDCACYGFDIGTNLAELVQRILAHVPGDYKIRLGMGNPRHMAPYLEALLDCFADERLYKFIHVPVQSGSDRVLRAMNRRHTVEDYSRVAGAVAERFGDLFTLSTDLIVGHPGETQEDFDLTLKLLESTRPTVANITRFVARPGTPAARMEAGASPEYAPVADTVKHERSAALAAAFQRIATENNRKWVGSRCTAVTEKPGYREGTTICRNAAYRPVAVQGSFPAGVSLDVRITGAEPFALLADVL